MQYKCFSTARTFTSLEIPIQIKIRDYEALDKSEICKIDKPHMR